MQLGTRQADGATLRQHLQAAAAASGQADDLLLVPPVPTAVQAVWQAYLSLSAHRRTGMGPGPIVLTDVQAWCQLQGVRLTPWELDTLTAIDGAALRAANSKPTGATQ